MDVDEKGTLFEGYELKLNSYDLGVDIELADAIERLRFEHPQVKVILLRSGKPRVFCAGANIRMLAGATHAHKVNFCKFTNETRNGIEDASEVSGLFTICVINGTAAGGGYELALATDHIMLVDDGSSAVSLPELPLLAVLPGTGGLTRVTDKRKVRRDRADVFCTTEEGIKGRRAVDWRLVDEVVPSSRLEEAVAKRAREFTARSSRPAAGKGIALTPLKRERSADAVEYSTLSVEFDRALRRATITLLGPEAPPPASAEAMVDVGAQFWPLRLARELDDAILDIRANEFDTAAIIFKSSGDPAQVLAYDQFLDFSVPSPLTLTKDPKDTYDGSHYSRKINEKVLATLLANREDAAIDWRGQDAATLIPVYRDKLAEFMATTSRADAGATQKPEKKPETN